MNANLDTFGNVTPSVETSVVVTLMAVFAETAFGSTAFAACTEKMARPAVVGVPLSTPVGDNVKPGGSVPEASDHVIGNVPVAVNVKV